MPEKAKLEARGMAAWCSVQDQEGQLKGEMFF